MTSLEIGAYYRVPVEFLPYEPVYHDVARALVRLIEARATDGIVEHVGSTAVPGCAGKGVIDLALLYLEGRLQRMSEALAALGFQRQEGPDPFPESRPMRVGAVTYGGRSFRVHVHVIASGSAEHAGMVAFRDLLRRDPAARAEYEAAKKAILARGIREGAVYAREKSSVVERLSGRSPSGA